MRQQYHSRLVNGERLVWDVNKLVDLIVDLPVKQVSLSDIQELHEEFWYEGDFAVRPTCANVALHAKLIQETDLQYPIVLCPSGRVMDGMHRVCKAHMLGHETIAVVQLEQLPEPDYTNVDLSDLPYDD